MWTRVLLLVLINSATVFAQTVPDFSGVFLETETRGHYRNRAWSRQPDSPLILEIEQNAYFLRIIERQNGSHAIYLYNLDGSAAKNETPQDGQSTDRVHFKGGSLIIRSEVTGDGQGHEIRKETWSLSPDLHNLTMEPGWDTPANSAISLFIPTEIYARRGSLEAALEEAAKTSRMNNCVPSQRYPGKHARNLLGGFPLGATDFRQLGWTQTFSAFLNGESLANLRLVSTPNGVEVRKGKDLVPQYSGSLNLIVLPAIRKGTHWMGSTANLEMGGWRFTDALKDLRFHILWVGAETRDLGEISATLKTDSYRPGFPLEGAYTMDVPADNVPITDSLEVHILSSAGVQLGCIAGHI